jgi:hypothetical protein
MLSIAKSFRVLVILKTPISLGRRSMTEMKTKMRIALLAKSYDS